MSPFRSAFNASLFCFIFLYSTFIGSSEPDPLAHYFNEIPSAWKGHRPFAEWLVAYKKPAHIVDLGVDYGYSTFVWAKAARTNGGLVTGIDLFSGDNFTGKRNTYELVKTWIEEFTLNNLTLIKGDFKEVSLEWSSPVDILHIDGYHTYDAVCSDFESWAPFVHDDGIILFHDINVPNPDFGIIHFFRELSGGHKLYFLHSCGLGIFTKSDELADEIKKNFPAVYDFEVTPL